MSENNRMDREVAIEFDVEEDGRWIAEAAGLPGVLCYGATQEEARAKAQTLVREVNAEQARRRGNRI